MAESTGKEEVGEGGSPQLPYSPPLPHCPLPFPSHPFLGWALSSEPPKEGEEGRNPGELGKEPRAGGAHLGQTGGETGTALVCGGPLPGPARSLPPERAGSLLPRPLGRKETRLTLGLMRDTRHSLAVGRRELRESLGGGEPGRSRGSRTPGECAGRTGPLTICLLQPGQVPIMDEPVASSSLFPCG